MAEHQQSNLAQQSEQQQVGSVYAKALIGAADAAATTDSVLDELDSLVADVLDKLPGLDAALASPRVSQLEKEALLEKGVGGKLSRTMINFLKVLCKHQRFDCLRMVARVARHMDNELKGRVEATLITAEPVSDEVRNKIAAHLQRSLGKEVDLLATTRKEIIGGFMVRVGDTVYDGSVANQLHRVKDSAMHRALQEIRQSVDRFLIEA